MTVRGFAGLATVALASRSAEAPPRPFRAALPLLLVALLVLVLGFGAAIGWRLVVVLAGSLVVVAVLQAVRAAAERERRRRVADEWLLWGAVARPASVLLSWRARELSSPRLCSALARSMRRIEHEVRVVAPLGPVPLNKPALRRHRCLVRALHERLDDQARPVSLRGMVLVERLLTKSGSPFYSFVPGDVLAEALREALAALDPPSLAAAA